MEKDKLADYDKGELNVWICTLCGNENYTHYCNICNTSVYIKLVGSVSGNYVLKKMGKQYSDGNSAYEKQKQRTEELFNKVNKDQIRKDSELGNRIFAICAKHSELIDDFEVVKDMNRAMSERFDEVVDRFPNLAEVDYLISANEFIHMYSDPEFRLERKLKLMSFRKIVEALNKTNDSVKPKSYEDSVEVVEDEVKETIEDENHD